MRTAVPLPPNDNERIERLRALVPDLNEGHRDVALQGLADIAAGVCGTPIALVSLVGQTDQFFRARVGLDLEGTARSDSFCTHAIMDDDLFIVDDVAADERFADNPYVVGEPHIGFYAGKPLVTSDGRFRLGTVCVIDTHPRELEAFQAEVLHRLAATAVEIIEREHGLVVSTRLVGGLLDSIADCVVATDIDGIVRFLNPAAENLLGNAEGIDQPIEVVLPLERDGAVFDPHPVRQVLTAQRTMAVPDGTFLRRDEGHLIELADSIAPTTDMHGEVIGAVMVFRDVTVERELARQIEWQSTHDALTGLVNRPAFESALARRVAAVASPPTSSETGRRGVEQDAVLYLDLDRFKGVNDELGHAVGDQLLAQVAALLEAGVRGGDLVARVGGDEFAILLRGCGEAASVRIGRALLDSLRTLRSAFADRRAAIDASVGVVLLDDAELTVEEVLRRADSACFAAKHAGGGRVQIYDLGISEVEAWSGGVKWMNVLQLAIAEDRLRLDAQLIEPLTPGQKPSAEVLVRLIVDGETIRPGAFMFAAERFRLARALDSWVVQHTLDWLSEHPAAQATYETIHINLSGQSIGDVELADRFCDMIDASGVPGERLCFEITESNAVAELGRSAEFLERLSAKGCHFALDDFGRGFSSFDYLRRFPVEIVKIDGSFVEDLKNDDVAREMLASIVSVCRLLGKRTVAEWVDSDDTIEILRELRVDAVQGNFIAEPMPLSEFLA